MVRKILPYAVCFVAGFLLCMFFCRKANKKRQAMQDSEQPKAKVFKEYL